MPLALQVSSKTVGRVRTIAGTGKIVRSKRVEWEAGDISCAIHRHYNTLWRSKTVERVHWNSNSRTKMPFNLLPVYGTMSFGRVDGEWSNDDNVRKGLEILKEQGVRNIDTAQLYGQGASETCIGRVGAFKDFSIDTKWIGGWAGSAWASEETIIDTAKQSLERLRTAHVGIFYLHSPDNNTPYEETLKGVDQAYRNGWLKRFGISNFTPDETRRVIEVCQKNDYVLPSVYQGSYSAAARRVQDELIPLLREHSIAFYAYSPIAGGFLVSLRTRVYHVFQPLTRADKIKTIRS